MKRRLRFHTPEEIREHLSNQQKSGQTVKIYCARAKVAVSTFWNWRKRYRLDIPARTAIPFLRLPTAPSSDTSMFEILFANNTILKVPSDFNSDTLRTLISALR